MDNTLYSLSEQIGTCLLQRNHELVTVESCTGGWISKCITDVAGSSQWFGQGFITYSNRSKQHLLGVQQSVLDTYGAVSENVVRAMAAGALTRTAANVALAVSGVAGPTGGSDDKPVGTVWLGWQIRACSFHSQCVRLDGDREAVRREAVRLALSGLLRIYGDETV